MERRTLLASGLALLAAPALAQEQPYQDQAPQAPPPPQNGPAPAYSNDEVVDRVSDFLGVTAESAGAAVERLFKENGRPTGYIAGEEGSAAFIFGLRYGKGLLYMKDRPTQAVYWQGPSAGFDFGGNASRVFVLCYDLEFPDAIYRRFPGVEGSAYFIGGLGMTALTANDIVVVPIRSGVGLRLGANLGYLKFTSQPTWNPF